MSRSARQWEVGDALTRILEVGGRRLPFLRWSVLRMLLGMRNLTRDWQVGDGREEALAAHVLAHARAGDLDDVIRVIDDFCLTRSVMINVGDEKGEILDRAVQRVSPGLLLELGTYCGYSGLRMARVMPADARFCSIEFSHANAEIARRIWAHAGVDDRLTVVVGSLGDGGRRSNACGASAASPMGPLTLSSWTTTRTPTSPTSSASRIRAGCIPGRWSSPTT